MDFRAASGHSRTATNIVNIVQKIRASHLNRHGFIDVTVGLVVFQVIYLSLILLFCNIDYEADDTDSMSIGKIGCRGTCTEQQRPAVSRPSWSLKLGLKK